MEKTHNQHGKQEKSATECNSYQNDTSAKSDNTDLQGKYQCFNGLDSAKQSII